MIGAAFYFDESRASAPQRLLTKHNGTLQHARILACLSKPLQTYFHLFSNAQNQLIAGLRLRRINRVCRQNQYARLHAKSEK